MSNIENLTSKIIEDSKREAQRILESAKKEANDIMNSKEESAKKIKLDLIQKSNLEAKSKKDRIVSSAELKARNEKLEAKQEVINRTFNETISKLSKMKQEDFVSFLRKSISSLQLKGGEEIIVSKDFRESIDASLLADLNLRLAKEEREIPSGFIIINNGIEFNYTFEALVHSLREELEYEVASILFN
ncbi:V-type ATP synthase subunit E [Hathewaya histolytica]|uniref:V-type ATP synthase subunit E n=1 Tax=Hathewaya histolytica TaxID=1498 RepID=UPI003B67F875